MLFETRRRRARVPTPRREAKRTPTAGRGRCILHAPGTQPTREEAFFLSAARGWALERDQQPNGPSSCDVRAWAPPISWDTTNGSARVAGVGGGGGSFTREPVCAARDGACLLPIFIAAAAGRRSPSSSTPTTTTTTAVRQASRRLTRRRAEICALLLFRLRLRSPSSPSPSPSPPPSPASSSSARNASPSRACHGPDLSTSRRAPARRSVSGPAGFHAIYRRRRRGGSASVRVT
ncbi:hypothetical protein BC628DRAFT_1351738 [Trametes gibbosa]|nr:hypothetical protein BC628DRAFT_1351738 [Trametes gibbosa]